MKTKMKARQNLKEGDLVYWHDDKHGAPSELTSGIVLEVMPRNVYENESCLILCADEQVVIDSKFLSLGNSL